MLGSAVFFAESVQGAEVDGNVVFRGLAQERENEFDVGIAGLLGEVEDIG